MCCLPSTGPLAVGLQAVEGPQDRSLQGTLVQENNAKPRTRIGVDLGSIRILLQLGNLLRNGFLIYNDQMRKSGIM